jgi:nucleotide-binding universal stress UspA family protein
MVDGTAVAAPQAPPEAASDPLIPRNGRYVVGFDGSTASRIALDWATARAGELRRPLVLVGVLEEGEQSQAREGARELSVLLDDRARVLGAAEDAPPVSTLLVRGDVADALAHAAQAGDAVVVGTDKTGYAMGRILGIRSVQLTALARGVLIVVPVVDLRMRLGIVAAVADVPGTDDAVRIAAREAARRSVPLHLVHAVPFPADPAEQVRGDRLLARAVQVAAELPGSVQAVPHLVHRSPADALLNLTRDQALLVVRRSPHPGVLGVGRTMHDLLVNANVPLVVLPPA